MSDNVNNPSHYCVGKYQCIDVMKTVFGTEAVKAFCLCNAFKYVWRLNRKNGVEDAKKAQKYLGWYIEMCEEQSKKEKPIVHIDFKSDADYCDVGHLDPDGR